MDRKRGEMRDGLFRATKKRLTLTITIIPYVYLTWLCLRHNFPSALQLQAANQLHVSAATMLPGKQSASPLPTLLRCSEFPSHTFIACTGPAGSGPLPVRMGRAVRWPRQELVEWFNAGSPPRCRWQAMRSANN